MKACELWKTLKIRKPSFLWIALILLLESSTAFAQTKAERKELADEYLKRENYSKALENYQQLEGDPDWDNAIFANYMLALKKLKPNKVEAQVKKFQKRYPAEAAYQTYLFTYFRDELKDEKEARSYAQTKLNTWFMKLSDRTRSGIEFYLKQKEDALARTLLENGLKEFGLRELWKEQFRIYQQDKNYAGLASTTVSLLKDKMVEERILETHLQEAIQNPEYSRELRVQILKEIQARPGDVTMPSFLAWVYLQIRDYEGALQQYKALDLLENTGGIRTFQLGEFAVNNELNRIAIKCFESVVQFFPTSQYRFLAQQNLVQLRENLVKNTYPINPAEVRALVVDYTNLASSQYLNPYDLTMKVAELYGKYLNRPDSAIQILEESMKTRRWPLSIQNKAKVLLGDMYILKDEPWEASLLYGQVEKDEAETLTGYEAKLKNAKVFYFKGEFELCQEQLDVLKQSTSRDISNDAIELGLLLQDILAEDTTGYFLSKFADIDLLTFQGNYPAAIDQIEKLAFTVSNPVVLEKLKYRLFTNYQATRQFEKALKELDEIYKNKASDLYLDDALFYSGIIVSEQLKDKDKAIDFFLRLIKEIPGSVYVAEARKRLRILRGDSLN